MPCAGCVVPSRSTHRPQPHTKYGLHLLQVFGLELLISNFRACAPVHYTRPLWWTMNLFCWFIFPHLASPLFTGAGDFSAIPIGHVGRTHEVDRLPVTLFIMNKFLSRTIFLSVVSLMNAKIVIFYSVYSLMRRAGAPINNSGLIVRKLVVSLV